MGNEVEAILRLRVREEVTAQMKQAKDQLQQFQKQTDSSKASVTAFFRELAGPAAGFAGAAGLALLAKESINAAAQLELVERRAHAIFGDAFPALESSISSLAASTGRSESDLLSLANGIGELFKGSGIAQAGIVDLSTSLAGLSVDLASFSGASTSDAFNALKASLFGSEKQLRALGVVVDDNAVKQFALKQGIKGQIDTFSTAQQMLLRYGAIMEKTSDIQGDAARNTNSYAGAVEVFKGAWGDLLEELGKPGLQAAAQAIGFIADAAKSATGAIATLSGALSSVSARMGANNPFNPFKDAMEGSIEVGKGIDLTSAGLKGMTFDVKKTETDFKSMWKEAAGGTGGSAKAESAIKRVREQMKDLGDDIQSAKEKVSADLTQLDVAFADKMESINGSIKSTKDAIEDLQRSFARDLTGNATSKADRLIQEQDDITKLNEDLKKKMLEREGIVTRGLGIPVALTDEIQKISAEIEKRQAALDKLKGGLSSDEKGVFTKRSGQSDLERDISDKDQKKAELTDDFKRNLQARQDELGTLEAKKRLEQEAYGIQREEMLKTQIALEAFRTDYQNKMADMTKITEDAVKQMQKNLQTLQRELTAAQALEKAKFKLSAPTLGSTDSVTTSGSTIVPSSTPTSQNGSNAPQSVTIGPIYVTKEVDADALVQRITRAIQLQSLASA